LCFYSPPYSQCCCWVRPASETGLYRCRSAIGIVMGGALAVGGLLPLKGTAEALLTAWIWGLAKFYWVRGSAAFMFSTNFGHPALADRMIFAQF
jgi:hypothetical protein